MTGDRHDDPLGPARGVLTGLVLGVLVLVLLILGGLAAGKAAAAELSPDPVELDGRITALHAEVSVYMASAGYSAPFAPVYVETPEWFAQTFASVDGVATGETFVHGAATATGTALHPRVVGWVNSPRRFGTLVVILAHEIAHRRQAIAPRTVAWTELDDALEEATTQAVADDIAEDILRARYPRAYRHWGGPGEFYTSASTMIRVCSARATRGSWRTARAEAWRKRIWKATPPNRLRLVRACGVKV